MLRKILAIILLLPAAVGLAGPAATGSAADSLALLRDIHDLPADIAVVIDTTLQQKAVADTSSWNRLPWYKQLWDTGFHIHDPRINYPAFPKFCLRVYDWGDRTFNSYDHDYVVGTGKNWKVMLKNYNWMESYMLMFSIHSRDMLHLRSDIYNDAGAYLSFMAVSVGYTAKLNSLFGGADNERHNFNFNFTCSRFSANFDYTTTRGNTMITHIGSFHNKELLPYRFNDISHKSTSGDLYYFFNYRRYSQAAAYSFSKYQLKSAGTGILGFAFNHQRIDLDFHSLSPEMKEALPGLEDEYHFRYTDYGILGGYAYNWAIRPRTWLFNVTALPSIGYRHTYSYSSEGRKDMLSSNIRLRLAFVYNHRALFASLTGRFDGNLYFNSRYAFFNSIESLSLIVGARF